MTAITIVMVMVATGGAPTPKPRHLGPTLGAVLIVPGPQTKAEIRGQDFAVLKAMRRQLWIDSVSIDFYLYQKGYRYGRPGPGPDTVTPNELFLLGKEAASLGLSLTLRPLIRVMPCNPPDSVVQSCGWEGQIKPINKRGWFINLYRAELPYLKVAKRLHASTFVVGSELLGLSHQPKEWKWLFGAESRVAPRIALQSAVSTLAYFPRGHRPGALVPDDTYSRYGLDFYPASGQSSATRNIPHLSSGALGPHTPVSKLARLMELMLRTALPRDVWKSTTMDETGIAAVPTGYQEPSRFTYPRGEPTDAQVQAHWFSAVCEAVKALRMPGVYFDPINLAESPQHWWLGPTTSFMGREPSMRALRGCAARFGRIPRGD